MDIAPHVFAKRMGIFATCMVLSTSLWAGPFHISVTNYNGLDANATLKAQVDQVISQLETEVNKNLPEADPSNYLKGIGNSTVMSGKGIGTDYASNIDWFVIGGGVHAGADLGSNSFSDALSGKVDAVQLRGVGAAASVMAGINAGILPGISTIGPVELNRLRLYMNYYSGNVPKIDNSVSGTLKSFGFHGQYKYFKERSFLGGVFKWGGLDVSSGFEYTGMNVKFVKTFADTATQRITGTGTAYDNNNFTASYTGTATAGADAKTYSIPIEVSTNMRVLWIMTMYGGFGLDYNWGTSKAIADASGTFSGSTTGANVAGNIGLNLGNEGKPSSTNFRGFVGTQFNLTLLKIYAQLQKSFTMSNTYAVGAGARIAW